MLIVLAAVACIALLVGGVLVAFAYSMSDATPNNRVIGVAIAIAIFGLIGAIIFIFVGLRNLAVWLFG